MKIILKKDIPKIGKRNEVKDVADGYALNFVIPKGLGVKATPEAIKNLEMKKNADATEKKIQENLLKKSLEEVSSITVTIKSKVNEKGNLFEGINKEKLLKEIEKATGILLEQDYIELAKPIKEVGEFIIPVSAHGNKGKVKVVVEGE
jgi:large subunit ribosomal protein L9